MTLEGFFMQTKTALDEILERSRATQHELEQEVDRLLSGKREQFQYQLQRGKVVFDRGMNRLQRRYRTGLWVYIRQAPLSCILSTPVIYGMIIPLLILDLSITVYQHICFRVYGIPRVRRANYITIDRHHLAYLNVIEKLNCVYCGYSNGLIEYCREITARTEQYWCPIKHAHRVMSSHARAQEYFDFGDAEAYRNGLASRRKDW
jgi:hypothetical protein